MYKARRFAVWACLCLVALACLSCTLEMPTGSVGGSSIARAAVKKATPDPGQVGPYAIGHMSFMLTDPSRPTLVGDPRPIPVEVFYPVDPFVATTWADEAVYPLDPISGMWPETVSSEWEEHGNDPAYEEPPPSSGRPFPLVVFSPGWGGPIWGHNLLAGRIASHGFVVAVMYHFGDAWFPWEQFDPIAVACLNRPQDVSFVLDDLLARNATAGDLLSGLINSERIAASGWSLGGYASMVLAAGISDVGRVFNGPPETRVALPPDPRIKAIVPLDGSNQVFLFQELARVTVPSIGIGQEWSTLAAAGFASWQARQHAAFRGLPHYRVDVSGADHPSFSNLISAVALVYSRGLITEELYNSMRAGLGSASLPNSESNRLAAKYAIAFLQTVLAGKTGYQDILTPGHVLKREQYLEFFVTEKRSPNSIDEDWPGEFIYFKHQPGSEQAKAEQNPQSVMGIQHMGLPR